MRTKVKKLGANMQQQVPHVLRPFFDFMDCFTLFKAHNMVALMLDLWFKDLSLVGDYVDHSFVIEIVATEDREFFLLTFKTLYYKYHGCSMLLQLLRKKLCVILMLFLE